MGVFDGTAQVSTWAGTGDSRRELSQAPAFATYRCRLGTARFEPLATEGHTSISEAVLDLVEAVASIRSTRARRPGP